MILVDANILVYSHVESFARHKTAREWLDAYAGIPLYEPARAALKNERPYREITRRSSASISHHFIGASVAVTTLKRELCVF